MKMLTNQTSGYPDFETDVGWTAAFNADPFHEWTFPERLKYRFDRPPQFPPGTNWSYSHANFMILGEILAKIGGKPLDVLLQQQVLGPIGLTNTTATETSAIPSPVLNTYSSERKAALGVPPGNPFYEDATYWNTQWGTPIGVNETTNIDDMVKTAVKVGTGALLSRSSYDLQAASPPASPRSRPTTTGSAWCGQGTGWSRTRSSVVKPRSRRICSRRRSPSPWRSPSNPRRSTRRGTTSSRTPATRSSMRSPSTQRRTTHRRSPDEH